MNNSMIILSVLIILSCVVSAQNEEQFDSREELNLLKEKETLEKETREGILAYIADLNAPDWRTRLEKRQPGDEKHKQFIEFYQKFRDAYQNMQLETIHLAIDGEEAILWLRITATHAGQTEDILKNLDPTNQKVVWEEVWFFDMRDGKFGDKWDLFVRDLDKMQSVGTYEVPADYFENR